ncbi:glycoside hydrolase family 3 C-terminal domain-containing protein [Bifidobacterium choloepi]|uniref:Glycoside hydrolase family 3 protein n=1 Tax=Bifidobacterium choloepi TaxID=2614131 RepID=A0A6I5NMJ6_9BIFI|nr:glycoside hydrolase family 3 C-terminal domain-containing protein [Bifidobacterium choloepi]NEG69962.1 glycoside hydrolase family 3 protein [Bifidobacterium choloepi]
MGLEDDLRKCSPIELAALLSGEDMWTSRGNVRAAVPKFVMSDGPHGVRCAVGMASDLPGTECAKEATSFPCGVNLAMSWDPDLAKTVGAAMADQARALGVNVLLGPAVNIQRNPLCGRNFEYLSEDPQVSGRIGAGLVKGIQSRGIAACPKHFAVNSQELRRQASDSVVDERTLRELYLTAFELVVRLSGPLTMMTSYNQVNGVYSHENRHLLTDILRNEWGFDGMTMSDWGGSNTAVGAALAGGSLEMPSPGLTSLRELEAAFRAGTVTHDDLLARALEVAKVARETYYDVPGDAPDLMSRKKKLQIGDDLLDRGHSLAFDAAVQTLTLLKNDSVAPYGGNTLDDSSAGSSATPEPGATGDSTGDATGDTTGAAATTVPALPLRPGCRVAVVGDLAVHARFQGGGSSEVTTHRADTILDALDALAEQPRESSRLDGRAAGQPGHRFTVVGYADGYRRDGKPDAGKLHEATKLARRDDVDVVVAVVGLTEADESESVDRATMALPKAQDNLMGALAALRKRTGKPVVAVLVAGGPVELPWADDVDGLLYTGLAGEAAGAATAAVLAGDVNPSGHLAQTWPLTYADCPNAAWFPAPGPHAIYREGPFVGYRYFATAGRPVRFPFGFGLSYSRFTLSDLEVNQWGVACIVSNDSPVDGKAVVQLYVAAPTDGGPHVARELKGFAKVDVPAGGRREARIEFDEMTFRHFDAGDGAWHVTSGAWTVMVGTSCVDLPLSSLVHIHGDRSPHPTDPALGSLAYADVHHATADDVRAMFRLARTPLPGERGTAPDVEDAGGARTGKSFRATSGSATMPRPEHRNPEVNGENLVPNEDPKPFGPNVPLSSWTRADGRLARLFAGSLQRKASKPDQHGAPDMGALFVLNMPPRAMQKMAGGKVDRAIVDDLVDFANGHALRAAARLVHDVPANMWTNTLAANKLRRAGRR